LVVGVGVFRDFYATMAQLPVLLLALVWDSNYLQRLRNQRPADPYRLVDRGQRAGPVEALVRTVVVEVLGELVEDGAGVSLVVDQQSVGALFADATNEPFRVAVRPGCPAPAKLTWAARLASDRSTTQCRPDDGP
jgi:hypothetical protein